MVQTVGGKGRGGKEVSLTLLATAKTEQCRWYTNEIQLQSTGAITLTRGKTEVLGEKPYTVPPCLPLTPHGLAGQVSQPEQT